MARNADFWTVANRVFTAHEHGRYQEALDTVKEAAPQFPDRAETIVYWEACTHARLNTPERVLAVLQEGIQQGLWWAPDMLRRDPDLESVREDPAFAAIVETCKNRLSAARATSAPQLHIYPPDQPSSASPLLIALHWRIRHLVDFTPWWLPAVEQGVLVAVPRSSQQLGMQAFGWDDPERTTRDITQAYDRLRTTEQFDAAKVIVAGASQGGAVTLNMALSGAPVPARGFIVVVPAIHDLDALVFDVESAVQRGVRGWVVTGERDYGRDTALSLGERLNDLGVPCHVEVIPGLGHDFPNDFADRLPSALSYVLA